MSSASEPRRAVVDINLFVSGLISKLGQPNRLVTHFRQDSFTLVISNQLRSELEEVLSREKFVVKYRITAEERAEFLLLIDTKAIFVNPQRRLPVVIRDPKDSIVLATGIGGRADYIVTGDEDLLVLNGNSRIGAISILTVRQFLDILEGRT
jgi:putative PIN family toxin of toxin-antitoxin system